jgi:hypothetical protein
VADQAIGGAREIFAALDRIGAGQFGGNAGRIGGVIVRQRHRRAAGKSHRAGDESVPEIDAERDEDDGGDDG